MFRINRIPITGQYLGSMKSQILNYIDHLLCAGFLITLILMTSNIEFIPSLFHVIPVFGISAFPNTDQYLGLMDSQLLTQFGDTLCVVFPYTLNPVTPITEFIRRYASKISIWDWRNHKHWPNLAICCVFFFHSFSTQRLKILKLFDVVFPKY